MRAVRSIESSPARLRETLLAIAACLVLAGAVFAQAGDEGDADAAATPTAPGELSEEIFVQGTAGTVAHSASVAAKMEIPLLEIPASVSVVTRALNEEQDARTLGDALRNVSGVNVHTQVGVTDFFLVRGFDSLSSGLVLTDGIAEPEATFYRLYNVERVEVLKGPGSFLYGGNALAGTVNLLRREPQRRSFWSAEAGAGSFDTYDAAFDANFSAGGPLRFRLNGLWRETDGFRDDIGGRSLALNPVLDVAATPRNLVRVDVEVMENDYTPDAGLPISGDMAFDLPRRRSYQSPFDFSEQDVGRLRVNWEATVGSALSLHNRAYYSELDWRSDGTIFDGVFPVPTGELFVFRTLLPLDDDQRWIGDQFEALLAGTKHEWLFGLELAERRDTFTIEVAPLPPIALFDPMEAAAARPPALPGFGEAGDAERRFVAPYVLDRAMLSERWQLLWGVRADLMDFEDAVTGESSSDEELSPLLGLVYAASDRLTGYLNAGRSFSPPSTRVSGELEPEKSDQVELGVKAALMSGRMLGSLSVYQLEREDIAIFDPNGFTAQTGSQRSRGAELELAGSLRNGLRYHFACAFNDSELEEFNERVFAPPTFQPVVIDRSGNDPALAPEDTWNVWIAKSFENGFGVAGGGRYVSDHFIAPDNAFRIDDYLTFDAAAFYAFDRWRLALNFENLTDEEYATRGFGSTSVIPAAGTGVSLSVDYGR